ncbi:MAG: hypothetical protein V3V49_05795 [Candidatus Krumholzibacteria bacterium]
MRIVLYLRDEDLIKVIGSTGKQDAFRFTTQGLHRAELSEVKKERQDEHDSIFRKDGDYWTLKYDGKKVRLKDIKGMNYISHLLLYPNQKFRALELTQLFSKGTGVINAKPSDFDADQPVVTGLGNAGPILDSKAKEEYRERLNTLQKEREDAEKDSDQARLSKINEEAELLISQLGGAYGLGGRGRKALDNEENVRKAVSKSIKEAIKRIGRSHPTLARHLSDHIHPGRTCSYNPPEPIDWLL